MGESVLEVDVLEDIFLFWKAGKNIIK